MTAWSKGKVPLFHKTKTGMNNNNKKKTKEKKV